MENNIFGRAALLLLLVLCISCSKDRDDENSILGRWIETAPVAGRTTLHFAPGNRLLQIDQDGNMEEFIYRIEGDSLYTSLPELEGSSEIFFQEINPDKIKLGNLYPSIPEDDPVFIIFERE